MGILGKYLETSRNNSNAFMLNQQISVELWKTIVGQNEVVFVLLMQDGVLLLPKAPNIQTVATYAQRNGFDVPRGSIPGYLTLGAQREIKKLTYFTRETEKVKKVCALIWKYQPLEFRQINKGMFKFEQGG